MHQSPAPYGVAYVVLHSALSVPDKVGKWSGSQIALVDRNSALTNGGYAPVGNPDDQLKWNPSWPDYEVVKQSVTKWISMSQKDELAILDALFRDRERLPPPLEFVMQMRVAIPVMVIFNFLRNHAFVR